MKRWIALGALVAGLALLVAAAPTLPANYEAPIPAVERARNAAILTALAAAGIERAWVDAGDAAVIVVYEVPAALGVNATQAFVLGAAAVAAPDARELIARTTSGIEWRLAAAELLAYHAEEISRAELEARVTRR